MIGYHVTTPHKLDRYKQSGCILPPVRFWPNKETALRWAKRTGRTIVLQIEVENSFPLPDHKPARWSGDIVRTWSECPAVDKQSLSVD